MAYKIPKINNYEEIMFDAIVDVNGNGTHTTLQSALDAGKRKIFLMNGTHTWDLSGKVQGFAWDSTNNSSIELYGESMEHTIIKILADSTTYCVFDLDNIGTYPTVPYNFFRVTSFDRSTGKLTFDTDPSGSYSVNDVIKIHTDYYYLPFSHWTTVTAVDSTSITVSDPNYVPLNNLTSGSVYVEIVTLPTGYVKPNFIAKNLTFHYDSTDNIYFDAFDPQYRYMENCVCENVKFKSTTNNALNFDYWTWHADNQKWSNCIFENCRVNYRTYLENCHIDGGCFNNEKLLLLNNCIITNSKIFLSPLPISVNYFNSTLVFRNCWTSDIKELFLNIVYNCIQNGQLTLKGNIETLDNYDVYLDNVKTIMQIINTSTTINNETREYIGVDTSISAKTLTLDDNSGTIPFIEGKTFHIKDVSGNASTNNIIIDGTTLGHTIDGQSSIVLNQDYAAVTLIYQGNNKWSIF